MTKAQRLFTVVCSEVRGEGSGHINFPEGRHNQLYEAGAEGRGRKGDRRGRHSSGHVEVASPSAWIILDLRVKCSLGST